MIQEPAILTLFQAGVLTQLEPAVGDWLVRGAALAILGMQSAILRLGWTMKRWQDAYPGKARKQLDDAIAPLRASVDELHRDVEAVRHHLFGVRGDNGITSELGDVQVSVHGLSVDVNQLTTRVAILETKDQRRHA